MPPIFMRRPVPTTSEFDQSNKSQSFAKSLLDVADNLERAAGAVPEAALQPESGMSAAELSKHLQTLLQGVQLTDKQLTSVS